MTGIREEWLPVVIAGGLLVLSPPGEVGTVLQAMFLLVLASVWATRWALRADRDTRERT